MIIIISPGYFELLVKQTLNDLLQGGYIKPSYHYDAEYGEPQMYSLTEDGARYIEDRREC